MAASRISCPFCQAALRIRDRSLIGRQVACPDCGEALAVQSDGPRELKIVAPSSVEAVAQSSALPSTPRRPAPNSQESENPAKLAATAKTGAPSRTVAGRFALSPPLIGWAIAGTTLAGLLGFAFWPEEGTSQPAAAGSAEPRTAVVAPGSIPVTTIAGDKALPGSGLVLPPADRDEQIRQRMAALWLEVRGFQEAAGRLPGGQAAARSVPLDQRFGWLAEMQAHRHDEAKLRPQWDLSWRDPLNERFVRRSLAMFQNPAIPELVGEHGYPATHFAGMGGLDRDGPELPVTDPRAGAFGYGRTTRLEDIRDGASQTILMAGVADRLTSWAAEGAGTIRPATRPPFVNGPDGFSTGQADGMFVLMADGSVRFLNRAIDPAAFKRLVTIAEGVPADHDSSVPNPQPDGPVAAPDPRRGMNGQPIAAGAQPAADPDGLGAVRDILDDIEKPRGVNGNSVAPPAPANGNAPAVNGAAPLPELPPPVDLNRMLAQKIERYELIRSVPLNEVLKELEELVGVPIHRKQPLPAVAEQHVDAVWQQPVSLSFTNGTVGSLLSAVLERAGLKFEPGESVILVLPLKE